MQTFERLTKLSSNSTLDKSIVHFFAGSLAGSAAVIASHPIDVLRTRFVGQGEPKIYKNYFQAVRSISMCDGLVGFYRGLIPAIILYAPVSAFTFGFYQIFNSFWDRFDKPTLNAYVYSVNAGISGLLAKLIVYPFDLTKKRLEVVNFDEARRRFGQTRQYSGMINCFSEIIRFEGFAGLYKGVTPSLVKAYLSTTVTLTVYEYICDRLREKSNDEQFECK